MGHPLGHSVLENLSPRIDRHISLIECVDLMVEVLCLQGQTVIFIDALDECYNPYELLSCLESIQKHSARVKYFLTSRFSIPKDINFPNAKIISSFASSSDIENFIKCETTSRERTVRSGMTADQAAEIQALLASHADGM